MNWIIVLSSVEAAAWVLDNARMAFRDTAKQTRRLAPGDRAAIYLTTRATRSYPGIFGLRRVLSPVRREYVSVAGQDFAATCRLEVQTRVPTEKAVDFRRLVPRMHFIRNKNHWQFYFFGSLVSIPDQDFEAIERAVRHQASVAG